MSGIVHFKFKSSNTYDSVSFDGAFVSVGELKNLIADKKGLSKDATSELLLSDPRTQAEHNDDSAVIPKSSSVLVRRVPNLHPSASQKPHITSAAARQNSSLAQPAAAPQPPASTSAPDDEFGGDLYSEQRDEDEALTQLLAQTGQQWEKQVKEGASRGRGRGFRGRGGFVGRGREAPPAALPKGYICFRCGQTGHHISDCPSSADPDAKRIRPAVGVPTALLTKSTGGGLLLPDGTTGSLQPNEDAFLKEIGGMPKAQAPTVAEPSISAPEGEKGLEAEKGGSKAIVPVSEGEPTLVGSAELGMPGLLMPPEGGMPPWDLGMAPPMPQLPLPGAGEVLPNLPLSREEFQRMQEQLRRRKDRGPKHSASHSPSRRDDRRRKMRDSRSPRRRESPRRGHRNHRRRERSSSEERRARRRSVSPPFIQLRKRSNSPKPRRRRTSRSRTPPVQLRRKESKSPQRHRSRRRESTRWHPEGAGSPGNQSKGSAEQPPQGEFHAGEGFDTPKAADGTQAASTSGRDVKRPAADFSVPELMDEPNASLFWREEPGSNGMQSMPPVLKNKMVGAGAALSRLQRGVGSRWKAEDEEDAAEKAKATAGGLEQDSGRDPTGAALGTRSFEMREAEMAVQRRENKEAWPSPQSSVIAVPSEARSVLETACKCGPISPDTGGKPAEADIAKGGTLPKTFSIPLEPAAEKKEKKSKRGKEKKDKDKEKKDKDKEKESKRKRKHSPKDEAEAEQTGLKAVSAYTSSAPETEHTTTTTSRRLSSSQGMGKRVRSDSTQDTKGDSTSEVDDAVKTRGRGDAQFRQVQGDSSWEKSPVKPAESRLASSEALGSGQPIHKGQPEVEACWVSMDKEKKSNKHKHKHKHSKKRHKDD